MAITTKLKDGGDYLDYPKLMISSASGIVVLMTESEAGTVLYSGTSNHATGYTSSEWDMRGFKDYTGKITLSNKG